MKTRSGLEYTNQKRINKQRKRQLQEFDEYSIIKRQNKLNKCQLQEFDEYSIIKRQDKLNNCENLLFLLPASLAVFIIYCLIYSN